MKEMIKVIRKRTVAILKNKLPSRERGDNSTMSLSYVGKAILAAQSN